MCGHSERAMTAASILARRGVRSLSVLAGGARDWTKATGRALVTVLQCPRSPELLRRGAVAVTGRHIPVVYRFPESSRRICPGYRSSQSMLALASRATGGTSG
ncbi:hypothetical protein GCM10010394_48260 [Streptomyces crystallinus]|uniref:Rhodanese domain-containing protein n=1 Tax=Streptomyces crystallinus TaxID=68191 RepID=A0ABP3RLK1_9ACTN